MIILLIYVMGAAAQAPILNLHRLYVHLFYRVDLEVKKIFFNRFGQWRGALRKGVLKGIKRGFQVAMVKNVRDVPEAVLRNYGPERHGKG
jgi:hypothetical protein